MSCAYCGERSDYTKEHIISSSVLDLFPECFATIDNARGKAYASDPVVKDVCSVCNNQKLSYIDNYAREFIEQYFVVDYSEDAILDFQYNYVLLQKVLLKYAFNDLRSHHGDTSFFTKDVREFLLNETLATPLSNVSILAGLAVNTSPVPDYFFGNLKLQWAEKPVFLSNSMVEFINYSTGKIFPRKEMEIESMEGLLLSYVFRFNSGQFILLCWDESNPKTKDSQTIARLQYPYTLLPENEGHALCLGLDQPSVQCRKVFLEVTGPCRFPAVLFLPDGCLQKFRGAGLHFIPHELPEIFVRATVEMLFRANLPHPAFVDQAIGTHGQGGIPDMLEVLLIVQFIQIALYGSIAS